MAADYQIWYSDAFGHGRRRLPRWARFVAWRRLNAIGELKELLLPLDDAPAVLTQRDARIEIWRDDQLLMETIWFVRRFGYAERDGVRYLRLGGYDGLYHLDGRVVAAASGSSEAVKSGPADDVIKAYIRENLGSLVADSDRDLSAYLTVAADEGAAPTVYRAAARQSLGKLIRGICFESAQRGTPLYVDLAPQPDGTLQLRTFTTARGMDHRRGGLGPVAISVDVGTLASSDRTRDYSDEHTFVYVGGRGLGAQRTVVEVEDTTRSGSSPFGRREVWIDARQLSTTDALTSAGDEILWQGLPDERISGVARAGFGERWGYGDLVEAAFDEDVLDCRIDGCTVRVDEQREETVSVELLDLAAETALLSVAQRVDDIGSQESPEYTQTPTPYAAPQAGSGGTLADGWLSSAIARLTDVAAEATARAAADAAEASTRAAADTAEATARAAADAAHAALTTSAHGGIVASSDSRLSDARTPTAHASSHKHGGSDEIATATPGANAIPKAGSGGTLADGWLSVAIARVADLTWANIAGKPSTFTPAAHAASHQHGGSDEIGTAAPGANAIPKAGAAGTLADGWLSASIARVSDLAAHAAVKDGVHGLANAGGYTLTIPASGTAALREAANTFTAGQTVRVSDAATTTTATAATFEHLSSGTPGAGFGVDLVYNAQDDTQNRSLALDRMTWVTATDASRKARRVFYAFDTAARECIRIEASGSAPMVGFNGVAAVARQSLAALSMSVGSGDNTVADVGAAFSQTTLNNNFRDVVDKINAIRTILVNVGIAV